MTAPSQPSVQQAFSGLSNDEIEILAQADRFGGRRYFRANQPSNCKEK